MACVESGSVFARIKAALQCNRVRELFHHENIDLAEFEGTLSNFRAMILDAHDVQLKMQPMDFTNRVRAAVSDADDLLDELNSNSKARRSSSSSKSITRQFNNIKTRLDALMIESRCFSGISPPRRSRDRSYFYLDKIEVLGREKEKEAIVGILLSDDVTEDDASYVSIVGMPGIGKTDLAYQVFIDLKIKSRFELCIWICISDHSQDLSVRSVFQEILENCLNRHVDDSCPLDWLVKAVKDNIKGKRLLLVLDDVWCEISHLWYDFKQFFGNHGNGSRVLITSRSKRVAAVIRSRYTYELKHLSDDHSWELFKKKAFQGQYGDDELLQVGREVSQKCYGNPFIIKVIASGLYGQHKRVWHEFKTTDFANIEFVIEAVMPILRLSYNNLDYNLKQCFGFCSIFPKNYVIQKQVLISLWLAQGYVDSTHEGQTMEEVGEDYCSTLLSRFFFQDIQRDEYGEVTSLKMPHIIHDLAQQVAGPDFLRLPGTNRSREVKIRHLSFSEYEDSNIDLFNNDLFKFESLHTILNLRGYGSCSFDDLAKLISCCTSIRTLDLHNMALQTLPDEFGKVPRLKFLDLSENEELEILPPSISGLRELQVLRLCGCKNLIMLPELSPVNHRILNVDGCDKLAKSVTGRDYYEQGNKGDVGEWKTLCNDGGDFLLKMGLLSASTIVEDTQLLASRTENADGSSEQGDARRITTLPNGVPVMSNSFPGLVKLTLAHIRGLQHLTPLRQLSYLKELCLRRMWNLECIESHEFALQSRISEQEKSFPSLEKLVLDWMPKLKGWWSDLISEDFDGNRPHMERRLLKTLLRLRDLSIQHCPNMTFFPPCPLVKSLKLQGINEALTFCMKGGVPKPLVTESSSEPNVDISGLEKLIISYDARVFKSVFREFFVAGVVDISINYCYGEQDLKITRELFQSCSSSLRNLSIDGLYNLKSLSDVGIQHLTKLQSLSIKECSKLDLEEVQVEMEEGMPWKSLNSLSSLTLDRIPKIVNLPEGLQHLASLQSLHIKRCKNLTVIGECLRDLTSFQALRIEDCKNLKTIPEYLKSQTTQL